MGDDLLEELRSMCCSVADTLNAFAEGKLHDVESGSMVSKDELIEAWIEEHGSEYDFEIDEERYEDLYTWLSDNYGVRVTTDLSGETVFGANICVAWGGPNIYIDTEDATVRGYWGCTTEVPFSYTARDMIEDIIDEWKSCYRWSGCK